VSCFIGGSDTSQTQQHSCSDDEKVNNYLRELHGHGIVSKETIQQLLLKELGVTMSEGCICTMLLVAHARIH